MPSTGPGVPEPRPGIALTAAELRSRRARNVAVGLAVAALVVLFYVITIVKLGARAFTMFDGT